jgi:hypothetical protein
MTEQVWDNLRYGLWKKDGQYGTYYGGSCELAKVVKWATDQIAKGNDSAWINVAKNDKPKGDKPSELNVTLKPFARTPSVEVKAKDEFDLGDFGL